MKIENKKKFKKKRKKYTGICIQNERKTTITTTCKKK